MQKVILDTNVIISSLIQKNYPYLIVDHCIEGNVILCLSNPILQEYIEVLYILRKWNIKNPKSFQFWYSNLLGYWKLEQSKGEPLSMPIYSHLLCLIQNQNCD